MRMIDLNADLGELVDGALDAAIMPFISSANIACGAHAGNTETMRRTVRLALDFKVAIGAHPGYPDPEHFGRISMDYSGDELAGLIRGQVLLLQTVAKEEGGLVRHIKLHGALYNDLADDYDRSLIVCRAMAGINPEFRVIGFSGSAFLRAAEDAGLVAVHEVFADRAYTAAGKLLPRSEPGAVLHEIADCMKQVERFVEGGCVLADSICVHGDNPAAVEFVKKLSGFFEERDIAVRPAGGLHFSFASLGERSLLAQLPSRISKSTHQKIRALEVSLNNVEGIQELVPCYSELKIDFDPARVSVGELRARIQHSVLSRVDLPAPRRIEVPVCYDGPDLERVADRNGVCVEAVVAMHAEPVYLVYMLGFSPGFAYLGGLNSGLATPRLETPRVSVPAGSVGIAGDQTGIYPVESPGGWNLIGRTPCSLFDPHVAEPFLFEAGDEVQFYPVSAEAFDAFG